MSDFIERLKVEKNELAEKKGKLVSFMNDEKFLKVSIQQRRLLIIQERAMETYLQCVEMRLSDLEEEE